MVKMKPYFAAGWESPEWVIFWGCVFCQMRR
ncbi:hypothetical protein ACUOCP_00690 [Escherichia sp. R-CC3]